MWDNLVHIIPTALDLLALFTCIGTLACRLWVLPSNAPDSPESKVLWARLWRLLAVSIAALTMSSVVELAARAAEMSSHPLTTLFPVLPTILLRTHYGQAWLIRPAALAVLCVGWWIGRQRLDSRAIPTFMLGTGTLIALTRSVSGHAADWGDLTLPELMDWLHLLTASVWGGGLLALSTLVLPAAIKLPDRRRTLTADIARRFSILAGIALGGVLLTGTYNAWLEVGSFRALWETPYGQTLVAKLLSLLALIILGASNRYISVPLLQRWAGRSLTGRGPLHRLLVIPYLARFQSNLREGRVARQFTRRVWAEAILVVGVLICTALLLHEAPARHFSNTGRERVMESQK